MLYNSAKHNWKLTPRPNLKHSMD